jgi:glycerol-3-phosphate acyltransferase PlsY
MAALRLSKDLPAPAAVAGAWALGSIPLSWIAARALSGVDLRKVGHGTVSGSGLYKVSGKLPLVLVGIGELAIGALAPRLAGRRRRLGALCAAAAITGHNWSPWLKGAGGRGISTALGAGLVLAPEATATLALGLGIGRLGRQTGLGCAAAMAALFPILRWTRGRQGLWIAASLVIPMAAKRVAGNRRPPAGAGWRLLVHRLLYDNDGEWEEDASGQQV